MGKSMLRFSGACCLVVLLGCVAMPQSTKAIVFLTRHDCVYAADMRANLDAALRAVGRSTAYTVLDADALPESDGRRGYGTPTVLVDNADLFEMPEPPPTQAAPT